MIAQALLRIRVGLGEAVFYGPGPLAGTLTPILLAVGGIAAVPGGSCRSSQSGLFETISWSLTTPSSGTWDNGADGYVQITELKPSLTKKFSAGSVKKGETLTLTFTLTNPADAAAQTGLAEQFGAIAVGGKANAAGYSGVAVGTYAQALGSRSLAFGRQAVSAAYSSVALGYVSYAQSEGAVAIGNSAWAANNRSIAIGGAVERDANGQLVTNWSAAEQTKAGGSQSIAMGVRARTKSLVVDDPDTVANEADPGGASDAIAIGTDAQANGDRSLAIGRQNQAGNEQSIGIGAGNTATGKLSIGIGSSNVASGEQSLSLGAGNNALGRGSISIGTETTAGGLRSIAFGVRASTKEANPDVPDDVAAIDAIAIGTNTKANGDRSVSIGTGSQASSGAVSIGDATARRIADRYV
jgi:hypothetical protein